MPDVKCVACRIRTRLAEAGAPCPACGSPLERVGELADVVGFRSITTTDGPVDATPVGDFITRRNAMYAQRVRDAVDAERWMDDGGLAAVAVAVALPTSGRITTLGSR